MEPVTHVLTGMCLARSGIHRRVRYATAAMAMAAEFPDIDVLWGLRGPISGFQHHRGITHTFLGIPFEAALLLLIVVAFHRAKWRNKAPAAAIPAPPVRWMALYFALVLALLSHLLLDYTNNYGIRPFFPFVDRWYAASIVFIVDPLILALLLAGLLLPVLFSLIAQEVSGGRKEPVASGWAMAALLGIVAVWSFREVQKEHAVALAAQQTTRLPSDGVRSGMGSAQGAAVLPMDPLATPMRTWASPDPLNPYRWYVANDFGSVYILSTANTNVGTLETQRTLARPPAGALIYAAMQSRLGRVYLDWSAMPWIWVASAKEETAAWDVHFEDVRFIGPRWLQHGAEPPLTGEVLLSRAGVVVAEGMDGRFGR